MTADVGRLLEQAALRRAVDAIAEILDLCDEAEQLVGEPAAWLLAAKIRKALEKAGIAS